MQSSERRATGDDGGFGRTVIAYERNHFIEYVFIELVMTDGFVCRFHLPIHPAFVVDAINGKHLYSPVIDQGFEGFDELESFIFQVVCRCGGNHQQGESIMAIGRNGHMFLERGTEPTGDFALHVFCSLSKVRFVPEAISFVASFHS